MTYKKKTDLCQRITGIIGTLEKPSHSLALILMRTDVELPAIRAFPFYFEHLFDI
jgi:hypothetical protein